MGIKETLILSMATKALKYGLKNLRPFMSAYGFIRVVDLALNEVESYFKEGSWRDIGTEMISTEIREYLNVPDSNPNN